MRVRQLERLLTTLGASATALDIVTRQLREATRLPIGGRGANAPHITGDEAAWIIIALASTETASQAVAGLSRQTELQLPREVEPRHSRSFVDTVQLILGSQEWAGNVVEIRVGRSHARSQVIYTNGDVENFVLPGMTAKQAEGVGTAAFRSEAVLSRGLLHQVAIELTGENVSADDL